MDLIIILYLVFSALFFVIVTPFAIGYVKHPISFKTWLQWSFACLLWPIAIFILIFIKEEK